MYVFVLLVGTSITKDCHAGSPLEDEWKALHAIQLGHDVVRGTVVDGAHPFRQMILPTCMLASNEVEWRNLWSIAKVDLRPTLPSNMAASAIIGPLYGCPTAKFPEIVEVTDVSDRLLVAYRIHSIPTNLCGVNPSALVVVKFISTKSWPSEPESIDETGRKQACGRPQAS